MNKLKSLSETAEILEIHPSTLRAWAQAKIVPYYRMGKKYFFDLDAMKKSTLSKAEASSLAAQQLTSQHNGVSILNGYLQVYVGKHPMANKRGYVPLHRLIMQGLLGRLLEMNEIVHHKNGNTLDNRICNLELFKSLGEHNAEYSVLGSYK
jgi:hypothetical protein